MLRKIKVKSKELLKKRKNKDMVKPINKIYILQAANQNYFADNVTGVSWAITTNVVTGRQAYKIALKNNSATDHSAKTVIFTGLDQDRKIQSETINMPAGNATVLTTLYYSDLETAVPSASIGVDTMDVGFTSQFSTPTIAMDYSSIGSELSVDYAGIMTYTVQATSDNIQRKAPPFYWQNAGSPFINATTPQNSYFPQAPRATRVIVTSYSGTPTFQFSILQQGNRG